MYLDLEFDFKRTIAWYIQVKINFNHCETLKQSPGPLHSFLLPVCQGVGGISSCQSFTFPHISIAIDSFSRRVPFLAL